MNRCDYLDPALAWTGVEDSGCGISLSTSSAGSCAARVAGAPRDTSRRARGLTSLRSFARGRGPESATLEAESATKRNAVRGGDSFSTICDPVLGSPRRGDVAAANDANADTFAPEW